MSAIQTKRFNWVRQPTAWQSMQTWRAKRQEQNDSFDSRMSTARDAFSTAQTNLTTGIAEISANIATKRMQQALQKKITDLTA